MKTNNATDDTGQMTIDTSALCEPDVSNWPQETVELIGWWQKVSPVDLCVLADWCSHKAEFDLGLLRVPYLACIEEIKVLGKYPDDIYAKGQALMTLLLDEAETADIAETQKLQGPEGFNAAVYLKKGFSQLREILLGAVAATIDLTDFKDEEWWESRLVDKRQEAMIANEKELRLIAAWLKNNPDQVPLAKSLIGSWENTAKELVETLQNVVERV